MTDLPKSELETKIEELLHMAVRGPISKALHAMAVWAFQQGRAQGLKEAKEKEKQ